MGRIPVMDWTYWFGISEGIHFPMARRECGARCRNLDRKIASRKIVATSEHGDECVRHASVGGVAKFKFHSGRFHHLYVAQVLS